jgi:hypothetical protein
MRILQGDGKKDQHTHTPFRHDVESCDLFHRFLYFLLEYANTFILDFAQSLHLLVENGPRKPRLLVCLLRSLRLLLFPLTSRQFAAAGNLS